MEKRIQMLEELETEAARFISELAPDTGHATLVTLSGELGAGKTAFVKAVAKTLGVGETITSPTFVLEKIYLLPPKFRHRMSEFGRLVHIDAYRLERGADLAPLGFDELMKDAGNLVMLEWPERVSDGLPSPSVKISFVVSQDGSRTLSYE